ncbi:LVIVD repeat-containing protein [Thalassotalea euphylliae]|uniref:LVIVD repeat-containing protein n=1 Tax=Thalassotalea euphylliae TaxID=1655234 RepID=UPI0015F27389|nr:beta-propeller domain-containing protein [Thalassotalea euphylliae]
MPIADFDAPKLLGSFDYSQVENIEYLQAQRGSDLQIVGDRLYVRVKADQSATELHWYAFDIADKSAPQALGQFSVNLTSSDYPTTTYIDGDYLYLHSEALTIVDISNIDDPKTLFSANLASMADDAFDESRWWPASAIYQDTLYLASYTKLLVIDISDKAAPDVVDYVASFPDENMQFEITTLQVYKNYLFVTNAGGYNSSEVLIYDIAAPEVPKLLSQVEATGFYSSVSISDGWLYLTTSEARPSDSIHDVYYPSYVRAYDIADISAPKFIHRYESVGKAGTLLSNKRGVLTSNGGAFSHPSSIKASAPRLGELTDIGTIQDIVIDKDIAYVATSEKRTCNT